MSESSVDSNQAARSACHSACPTEAPTFSEHFADSNFGQGAITGDGWGIETPVFTDDEDLHGNGFGVGFAKEIPSSGRQRYSENRESTRHPSHLTILLLVALAAWLHNHRPDKFSLKAQVRSRYGQPEPVKSASKLILSDHSFIGLPEKHTWYDLRLFAVGHVKTTRNKGKKYEHYYLGIGSTWFLLPYFPRIHRKGGDEQLGLGLCIRGSCICVPHKKKPCYAFAWDASAWLNILLVTNAGLFLYGLWVSRDLIDHPLNRHCVLRWQGLWAGSLRPVIFSPFFHRDWMELLRNMMVLANLLEAAEKEAGFLFFLLLLVGGSFLHFVAACLYYGVSGSTWLLPYHEGVGCRGGIVSLLALFSRVRPDERFRFSFYMIEFPKPLTPLQNLAATAAVDAFFAGQSGRPLMGEVVGHAVSFVYGRLLAEYLASM
eukprot:gnl/MRDRNA2_/MRDRNA2_136453_c0_seq1.p1 gnl/MRDRNA2_/MRDRNA2_136453_c0~~gnl/MRDRNA2_/MRDRNA2_136453_c0_seq1.p1  ORF type:complete len:431 (+),score=41.71 gnl/MRDRNA2_/MRDRNA2_136453_c0_seq1:118-1410(+)